MNLLGVYDGVCHNSIEDSSGRPLLFSETWTRRVEPEGKDHVFSVLPSMRVDVTMEKMSSLMIDSPTDAWRDMRLRPRVATIEPWNATPLPISRTKTADRRRNFDVVMVYVVDAGLVDVDRAGMISFAIDGKIFLMDPSRKIWY